MWDKVDIGDFVYYLIPTHVQLEMLNSCVAGILKLMSSFTKGVCSQVF